MILMRSLKAAINIRDGNEDRPSRLEWLKFRTFIFFDNRMLRIRSNGYEFLYVLACLFCLHV